MTLSDLTEVLREFNRRREWEQFHSPRNLVLALVGEVGELAAELQWVSDADTRHWLADAQNKSAFAGELADVFAYLLQLADSVDVDLASALMAKIELNEERYPVDLARGTSKRPEAMR